MENIKNTKIIKGAVIYIAIILTVSLLVQALYVYAQFERWGVIR